jgi:hypothetical protein
MSTILDILSYFFLEPFVFLVLFLFSISNSYLVYIFLIFIAIIILCPQIFYIYFDSNNQRFGKIKTIIIQIYNIVDRFLKFRFISKNIITIVILFTTLFFIDKFVYQRIIYQSTEDIQKNKRGVLSKFDKISFFSLDRLLHFKFIPNENTTGEESCRSETTIEYINPYNLDTIECLDNIKLKYISQEEVFFYGDDRVNGILCKAKSQYPITYENNNCHDQHIILTVSKKESK